MKDFIREDLPYFDLTTMLQNAPDKRARLELFSRGEIVMSGAGL